MKSLVLVLLVACGGGSGDPNAPGGSGGSAAAGATPRDAVVDAWKAGGLQPSAFAPATVPVGPDCKAGTVNGVDALICAFPTPDAAKAAEAAAYAWVGAATGMVQIRGSLVIAAADRRKADPSGRTINQVMKLAPK
jgi:hypothetical protein